MTKRVTPKSVRLPNELSGPVGRELEHRGISFTTLVLECLEQRYASEETAPEASVPPSNDFDESRSIALLEARLEALNRRLVKTHFLLGHLCREQLGDDRLRTLAAAVEEEVELELAD